MNEPLTNRQAWNIARYSPIQDWREEQLRDPIANRLWRATIEAEDALLAYLARVTVD